MRLCILMPAHWSATLGGAEIQMRYLLSHLRQSTDHEIFMICRRSLLSIDEGVPIYRIRTPTPVSRYSYLLDYPSVQCLLKRLDPDVVYTRVGSPLVGYAARYCKRFGKKLVHHIARLDDVLPRHMVPMRNRIQAIERPIYEYGLRNADAVITQASYQAELLHRHFRLRPPEVIPNYHPAPGAIPAKDRTLRTVLWVANLKSVKRPEVFVQLAERCNSIANTRFVMVGEIQDKRYEMLIGKARSLSNFHFAGALSLEAVNELLDRTHIFVNTSVPFGEGFPNTFIQAWLRGVPVVSLEVNPDHLLDDQDLGLCSAGSDEQLVSDVQALLRDDNRLNRMAQRAFEHGVAHYGADNLRRIQSVLEGCLESRTTA